MNFILKTDAIFTVSTGRLQQTTMVKSVWTDDRTLLIPVKYRLLDTVKMKL